METYEAESINTEGFFNNFISVAILSKKRVSSKVFTKRLQRCRLNLSGPFLSSEAHRILLGYQRAQKARLRENLSL